MLMFPDPAYPDSFYYVDVARALASGHGLNVDFVWIFAEVGGKLPADAVLPIPSNAHWLPLASFIQAPFIALMGATAIASALPLVLIGSLAAPLTWLIARDIGSSRTVQLGAGVMAAIPAAGAVFMAQPENFAIFQPLVAATLWFTARGLRGDTRAYAAAGLLVGLASIARNDAFLLGAAVGLVFVIDRVRAWRRRAPAHITVGAAVGCVALYLLIVVPWWYRQLSVFGSISPTASTGTALWLVDYRQWNSITADVSLSNFLAQGPAGIIGSRVGGLVSAAANFALIVGSLVLVPFVIWGAWRRRRSDDLLPWFLFTAILFAGAMIVFPLHVPGGAFIHTAVGLGPYAYILALEGVAAMVLAIARRRPAWDPARAIPLFSWVIVGFVVATGLLFAPVVQAGLARRCGSPARPSPPSSTAGRPRRPTGLMSIDAGGFKYFTGRRRRGLAGRPIDTIHDVAKAYDIRWLVLERDATVEALRPVLERDARPAWIGAPVFDVPATGRTRQSGAGALPRLLRPGRHPLRPARRDASRGVADGGRHLRRRPRRAGHRSPRQIVFPKPEDTAYYFGVARNLLEGRGLVSDALWSYQTPPLDLPAAGLRGLAAAADASSPRSRWPSSGATFAAAQVVVRSSSGRSCRSWPGGSRADVAAERGLPRSRARTLAIGAGLTAAVYLPLLLH